MKIKDIGLLVKPPFTVHNDGDNVLIEFDDGDSGRIILAELNGSLTLKIEGSNKFCFHSRKHFDVFVRRVNEIFENEKKLRWNQEGGLFLRNHIPPLG